MFWFIFQCLSISIGFETVILEPNQTHILDAKNKTLILFLPNLRPNQLTLTINQSFPISLSNFIERTIQTSDVIISFQSHANTQIILNYWILPFDFCPITSFYFDVEHLIHIDSDIIIKENDQQKETDPICIFSQTSFDMTKTNISTDNSLVTFYDMKMNQVKCKKKVDCVYESTGPFFLKVNESSHKMLHFALSSRIINKEVENEFHQTVFHCHFKPIIYWAGIAGIPSVFPGMINSVQCTNKYEEFISIAYASLCTSIFSAAIVLLLFIRKTCRKDTRNLQDTEYLMGDAPNI